MNKFEFKKKLFKKFVSNAVYLNFSRDPNKCKKKNCEENEADTVNET